MDSETHENVAITGMEAEGNHSGHSNSSGVSPPVKKRRRGPSQGPIALPNGQKRVIKTNRQGQPNLVDENTKALVSDIGLQIRELLPVAFDEYEQISKDSTDLVDSVINALMETYNLSYVKAAWLDEKMRKAWRDWRYSLRLKFIRGKTASEVKAGDTPNFVKLEDWHAFIDISTTPKFLAVSARNSANRGKVVIPNGSGRHSLAQVRHIIAEEKNLASDDDVGRTEAYIAMLSKKRKPDHEMIAKMQDYLNNEPDTRPTGPNDAVSKTFGKDKGKKMRAMGAGVSLSSIKEATHLNNKLNDAEKKLIESESLVHKLSKDMETFKSFVTNELAKAGKEKPIRSSESIHSPSPSLHTSRDNTDMGKKCDVLAWDKHLVARGEVVEVNPEAFAHNVRIGDGNYKILIEVVEDGKATLFKPNSQVQTIEEVCGSYTVWPKHFLSFYN